MEDVERIIRLLRPVLGDKADVYYKSYLVSAPEYRRHLRQCLDVLFARYVDDYRRDHILLPPPSSLPGEYHLGLSVYRIPMQPMALQTHELGQHMGVFGRTGSGKTSFVRHLLQQHLLLNRVVWVFDWKENYSDLAPVLQPPFFNPLDVKGVVDKDSYQRGIIELLLECYLPDLQLLTVQGVEFLLLRALDATRSSSLRSLAHWLERYKPRAREFEWKVTALHVLSKALKVVSDHDAPWPGQSVVFQLWRLGLKDRNFITKALFLRLYHHVQQMGPTSGLRLLVVVEEAHNILLRRDQESIIEQTLRQIREYGVGVVLVDQHPSMLSLPALGVYTTVVFNLPSRVDRDALSLPDSERLPSRHAIVRLQSRFLRPFLVKIPHVAKSKVIRRIRSEKRDYGIEDRYYDQSRALRLIRGVVKRRLSWEEALLVHAYAKPLLGSVDRYRALGVNEYQGNKLRRQFLDRGLIRMDSRSKGKGRVRLMTPTARGFSYLNERYKTGGRGGVEHEYWKRRLKGQLVSRGFRVDEEVRFQSSYIDLVTNNKVCVEIETGSNNTDQLRWNIKKGLELHGLVVCLFLHPHNFSFDDKRVIITNDEISCINAIEKNIRGDA